MLEEQAEVSLIETDRSPKSIAFPIDAIVIYSIVFTFPSTEPPPNTPRVLEEQAASALFT